jgi:hypothetical protein
MTLEADTKQGHAIHRQDRKQDRDGGLANCQERRHVVVKRFGENGPVIFG